MANEKGPVSLGEYAAFAGALILLITAFSLSSPKETAMVVGFVLLIGGLGVARRR